MKDKGTLQPRTHRLLWILLRTAALLLVMLGVGVMANVSLGAVNFRYGVGFFLVLSGLLIERNHRRWLEALWPPRCPECGGLMDATRKLWEAPDDSPMRYVEYACRSCAHKYTNDVLGKAIYGWPPREPYTHPEPEPFTLADGVKLAIAFVVIIGIVVFLYWTGLIGNPNCNPRCF